MRFLLAFVAAALLGQVASAQRTIRVPAEAPTIQAGINMAQAGDTVLLADGVYRGAGNKSLTMRAIDIRVRSEGGAAACIIDMEGDGRAMHFYQGQTAGYVVEGITFRNGRKLDKGGAIWIRGASPTIRDCVFEDCESYNGGAIWLEDSTSRIVGCVFQRCGTAAPGWTGGGILVSGGSPTVEKCDFHDCGAERGAGVAVVGGHIDVLDSTFNAGAARFGSAVWVGADATAVLVGSEVADNATTYWRSGAIHLMGAMSVRATDFVRNLGPGLYSEGDVNVAQCVVADHADTAFYLRTDSVVSECAFERNGRGILIFPPGAGFIDCTIERSEFRDNTVGLSSGSASVRHCRFIGNQTPAVGGGERYTIGPWFQHCEFRGNERGLAGYTKASDSVFIDNGPDFDVAWGTFTRCEFVGNTARTTLFQGYFSGSTIDECLIAHNRTTEPASWAGVVAGGNYLTIVNSTIVDNLGPSGAPVIAIWGWGDIATGPVHGLLQIRNSIINGGVPIIRASVLDPTYVIATATVDIDFSVVPGGPGAIELVGPADLIWGAGNIASDPRLADPAAGDYTPAPGSPCIDAGDNAELSPARMLDLAGLPRFHDDPGTPDRGAPDPARPELPIVDIGAYEFQGQSPCRADLDGDGELTFFDFVAFQNLFAAGDPRADFDFDGELTFFDFLAFQEAFAAGCP